MMKGWTDAAEAGLLDRRGERGKHFCLLSRRSAHARGLGDDAFEA
jgi:hypothetical protein